MGHTPGRLSANPSSVSGGTVGLSIPAPAARTCHGIAPGRSFMPSTWQMIRPATTVILPILVDVGIFTA